MEPETQNSLEPTSMGWGIASLIFGIISIVSLIFIIVSIISAVLSIIFGFIAFKKAIKD